MALTEERHMCKSREKNEYLISGIFFFGSGFRAVDNPGNNEFWISLDR